MKIGNIAGSGKTALAHENQVDPLTNDANNSYALYQDFYGDTRINAPPGKKLQLCINNVPGIELIEDVIGDPPMMNYLGAVSQFQGKLIMLDEVEIGGLNYTPSYVNSANVTETDDEGKAFLVKTGIVPQYYNRQYNGGIFRYKNVADFEVKIDIGATKGQQFENRHFQIRCGHQRWGGTNAYWEIATDGSSHLSQSYLQIGWKDFAAGEVAGWYNVNIAAQDAININGGTQGVLVSGSAGLKVNGSSVATTSDHRIKKNITDASGAYDLVDSINIRSYDYVDTTRPRCKYGFIAQEVEALIPEAVETSTGDFDEFGNMLVSNSEGATHHEMKYVKKDLLFQLLFSAFKESQTKIALLEDRLLAVEGLV